MALDRRMIVTAGLSLLTSVFSAGWLVGRKQRSEGLLVGELRIQFPAGYDLKKYESEVPAWVDSAKAREYIAKNIASKRLLKFSKRASDQHVSYFFKFSTKEDLDSFVSGVRDLDLVDFSSRQERGLITEMYVNGAKYEAKA